MYEAIIKDDIIILLLDGDFFLSIKQVNNRYKVIAISRYCKWLIDYGFKSDVKLTALKAIKAITNKLTEVII